MTLSSAYLLVSHGSRDPRPQIAVERLAYLISQQLVLNKNLSFLPSASPFCKTGGGFSVPLSAKIHEQLAGTTALLSKPQLPLVGTASLELAPIPLHESIQQFAKEVKAAGINRLQILPLFLLAGVHVKKDIPAEVALAQQRLGKTVKLELCSYLGRYLGLIELLSQQYAQLPAQGRILLSHGSRLAGGNQSCERIATQLQAIPAYWSVYPSLRQQVEVLATQGKHEIAILPYFLFNGGITEAIARQVQQLQSSFPNIQLQLGKPLGATSELATLIVEGMNR